MNVVRVYVLCLWLLAGASAQAVLNPTLAVDSGSTGGFWSSITTAYNTQTNKILAAWVTPEGLYSTLFNPNGTPYALPTLLLEYGGAISIASSAISSCYNTQNNQFLIMFLGAEGDYSMYFFIVDQTGALVSGPTVALTLTANPFSAPVCCYNSTTNQYGITSNNGDGQVCFVILNADGTVSSTTVIPGSTIASDTYTSSICYNSTANQYLISWQTSSETIVFAVYNANGTFDAGIGLVTVPFTPDLGDTVYSLTVPNIYNNNNQYLMAWTTINGGCYFVIYDATGTPVVTATPFATSTIDPSLSMFITGAFNPVDSTYFLTWMGIDAKYHYCIVARDGTIIVPKQSIPNYLTTGASAGGLGCVTYMPISGGSIYMTWINGYNTPVVNGFSAVYSGTSLGPLSTSTTLLNRFANYGEFFNQLSWWSPINASVSSYQIQRLTTLLATVPGTQMTYQDHNQSPDEQVDYTVSGFGSATTPIVLIGIQSGS